MRLAWILYCLVITISVIFFSLTQATRPSDYIFIVLLIPLVPTLIGDIRKYLKKIQFSRFQSHATSFSSTIPTSIKITPQGEEGVVVDPSIQDANRRMFLRLAGSTGALVFMMAVFGQKSAKAAFFGSMPGPGTVALKNSQGDVVDPAAAQPTDGYEISEIDDTGSDSYYGFVHQSGAWYITKESSTGAYRYTKGASNFAVSWALRATLSYDYFDNVF